VRIETIRDNLARVMPEPELIPISARTGEGLGLWMEWLERRRTAMGGVYLNEVALAHPYA
jgi:hypothetical protein